MLPIPVLDDEYFSEIVKNARSMIPRLHPGWTDYNSHDPGITFLELFAFLKESQQYHLDQIGPKSRRKYLKLLGMELLPRQAARTTAVVSGGERGQVLPQGTRLMAGEIPFETVCSLPMTGSRLKGGFAWDGERRTEFSAGAHGEMGKLQLEVFGRKAKLGSVWGLCFDGPWAAGTPLRLQLWLREDWPVARNPVKSERFTNLTKVEWEYFTHSGWKTLTVLEDETYGLLFGGRITLQSDEQPCRAKPGQDTEMLPDAEGGCWIRARLVQGEYDAPPVLTGLSDQVVPVAQRRTDARCVRLTAKDGVLFDDSLLSAVGEYQVFLHDEEGFWHSAESAREGTTFRTEQGVEGEALLLTWRPEFSLKRRLAVGDGFPNQSYALHGKGQLTDSFALLVEETDRPDVWSIWQRVEDFDISTPEDRHYILDEETGTVTFGDCIHGLAPEGQILIAGHAVTLGSAGNIKGGRLTAIHPEDLQQLAVGDHSLTLANPDDAHGGRDRETEEGCFSRFRRQMGRNDRAVTYEDYERLVRRTPGLMIANCKAIPVSRLPRRDGSFEENCVTVVVEPWSVETERVLSPAYEENILSYLDQRRMLGTKVALLSPEYIAITIYAEISSQPQYLDARQRVESAVADFFRKGWEFGEPVRYSQLYGIIDTLDCVQRVESLTIDAQGRGISRGINGDVILPHNGLAVLRAASYQVRPGE